MIISNGVALEDTMQLACRFVSSLCFKKSDLRFTTPCGSFSVMFATHINLNWLAKYLDVSRENTMKPTQDGCVLMVIKRSEYRIQNINV